MSHQLVVLVQRFSRRGRDVAPGAKVFGHLGTVKHLVKLAYGDERRAQQHKRSVAKLQKYLKHAVAASHHVKLPLRGDHHRAAERERQLHKLVSALGCRQTAALEHAEGLGRTSIDGEESGKHQRKILPAADWLQKKNME